VAYHAVSADGLRFERAPEVQTPGMTMLGNVTAVAGGYRFYGTWPGGIRSAVSEDGYTWRVEQGTRLPGSGDPGVVRLPDGTFLMVYTAPRR
jgi:hypothetical protein